MRSKNIYLACRVANDNAALSVSVCHGFCRHRTSIPRIGCHLPAVDLAPSEFALLPSGRRHVVFSSAAVARRFPLQERARRHLGQNLVLIYAQKSHSSTIVGHDCRTPQAFYQHGRLRQPPSLTAIYTAADASPLIFPWL